MPDALGVADQGVNLEGTSKDYLGVTSPTAFRGQPALPSGAGPAPAAGAPPATASGTAPGGPLKPTSSGPLSETTFADLSGAVGGPGDSPGMGDTGLGQNIDAAAGPGNIGFGIGLGPASINIGPTGTISVGARGDSPTTNALATGLNAALAGLSVPTSVNIPSLVASLAASPVLGMAAQFAGAAGVPMTIATLAHAIASLSPTSVTSLQAALANPDPEAQLTAAQALAVASGGAKGPTQGGPQSIGQLQMDNPVTNVPGTTQAGAPGRADTFAEATTLTPTFANLAQALGLGREDVGFTPSQGPTGPGESGTGPPGDSGGGDAGTGPF